VNDIPQHPSNHNLASLTPEEQAIYTIDAALEGPNTRWEQLKAGFEKAPEIIETETVAEGFTTIIAQLQALRDRINIAHRDAKEPWLAATTAIDGRSGRLRDLVEGAQKRLQERLTAYQVAKQNKIEDERRRQREIEAADPEPGWSPRLDASKHATKIRSVEGASAHLVDVTVVTIDDFRKIPLRYLQRPKVVAALQTEMLPDARKGDKIAGATVTTQKRSQVKR
jgi:hypothetical protein